MSEEKARKLHVVIDEPGSGQLQWKMRDFFCVLIKHSP